MTLELAIKYAKTNPIKSKGRTSISRFAAVLTNGWNTYIGFNTYRTHPLQARFAVKTGYPEKIHCHAEIAAIAKGTKDRNWNLDDYTLYVARVLADDTPALARPCPGCMSAISEFNIKHVEFT